jgi:sterol-4alpha-carboxylate 3-dehydrogenase (decarboxylating)
MSSPGPIPDIDSQHVLITGGTGFLGSWIIRQLLERHPTWRITVLDIQRPANWEPPGKNIAFIKADITNGHHAMSAFDIAKPTTVIHTAGYITTGNPRHSPSKVVRDLAYDINVNGTRHVIEAAKTAGAKSVVYTSSFAVVIDDSSRDHPNVDESAPIGNASLIYGQTKVLRVSS